MGRPSHGNVGGDAAPRQPGALASGEFVAAAVPAHRTISAQRERTVRLALRHRGGRGTLHREDPVAGCGAMRLRSWHRASALAGSHGSACGRKHKGRDQFCFDSNRVRRRRTRTQQDAEQNPQNPAGSNTPNVSSLPRTLSAREKHAGPNAGRASIHAASPLVRQSASPVPLVPVVGGVLNTGCSEIQETIDQTDQWHTQKQYD